MVNINSVEGIESLIEKRNRPLKGQIRELQAELIKLKQALTAPVDVENKELPVYKVVFNEGTGSGVASINLTKTPLLNDFVKTQKE
jgi:hypothetical protein